MKITRRGRLVVPKGVAGSVMAQVLRDPGIRADCLVAAEQIRREAARIARNQIGADDRVVRGYKVGNVPGGYFYVSNTARSNDGKAIGDNWETGTGIHYKKNLASPPSGKMIKASDHGKKRFVWLNPANEQAIGKEFISQFGDISVGEGRVRRTRGGQFRKRRYNPGRYIYAKQVEGFPGTHALEKAARNMAKVHKWSYTPGVK